MRVPQISNRRRAACERDLARLRRLEERHRVRAVMTRGARGSVGFLAGLGVVIKTKIAATLAGKLAIAALFGIGFAWPIVIVWVAGIGIAAIAVAAICQGEACAGADALVCCDCPNCAECDRKNKRRQRVIAMIAEREKWLENGFGPPPGRRRGGAHPA
jgi:hypothetical protein